MRLSILAAAGLSVLVATGYDGAAAHDPLTGTIESFFHYRPPPPPAGGDCAAIAAAIGPDLTWRGEFSGQRLDLSDNYQPYAARGCFESEIDCRIWQQQAINYAFGKITYTSCRRGVDY